MCTDASPNILGFFDTSVAPPFLFYSYIPIIVLVLFLGFFIYFKSKKTLLSKLILWISISFSLWILNILIQWMAVHVAVVQFAWQLTGIFEISVFLFSVYFFDAFMKKGDMSLRSKIFLLVLALPVILLTPTALNIVEFDLGYCEGTLGALWYYIYGLELALILWTVAIAIKRYIQAVDKKEKTGIVWLSIGTVSFLSIFYLSNLIGEITQQYDINLVGPIGMVIFIIGLSFLVVKYHILNMKIISSQVLIVGMIFFNFAILFIHDINNIRLVALITLVLTTTIGLLLVRSVKLVESQRAQLEEANENQKNLIHFISHQVKGFFTRSINVYSEVLSGSYGPVSEDMKWILEKGLDSERKGVDTVQDIFFSADLRKGVAAFNMDSDVDLCKMIREIYDLEKPTADKKGLTIDLHVADCEMKFKGDNEKLKEVFKNLIENAINYTPKGEVKISLTKDEKGILFAVKDNGFGLSDEDKSVLFKEGGRGKESSTVNPETSGYGLYISKRIVGAHKGTIWAESEGRNMGSTFSVLFPNS